MKRSTKITTIIIIFFIIIAAVIGGRYAMKIHFQKKFGKRPPPAVIVETVKSEITEGSENAKIKIYVYQSLTCPHCAVFHTEIYPLLKKDYIDTGVLKIYFRHFPLDLAALNAAKILQCIDEKNRISFLDHLYETQENWIKGTTIEDINQNLKKAVKKFGFSEKDFDTCLDLEDVENHVLNSRIEAVKNFKINSTPKVIINDKVFKDTLEYKNLKRAIEKLI